MAKKGASKGQTAPGHTRDVKTDRIGHVTIYKRGRTYYLYYRENGKSRRHRVEGNLNNARQAASNVNHALEESRPSPLVFEKVAVSRLIDEYVDIDTILVIFLLAGLVGVGYAR